MFRHPRIEQGNSSHGRLRDRIPRTLTPVKLDVEDTSRSAAGSMHKTSPEAPVPGESSAEAIVCIFCHQSFTTQENLRYHGRYCQSNPLVDPNSGLFNGLGGYGTVSPATSNIGQPGKEDSSPPQGAADTAEGMDKYSDTNSPVQEKGKWTADEDQILFESRLKGRSWTETSSHLPGRSPKSCRRRYQEEVLPQLLFLKNSIPSYEAESPSGELPPNFPSSSNHVVESYSHLEVVDNSDSDSQGEETSSLLNAISTPQGDYLISPEQLLSAASDGRPSDSTVEEVRGIITDLRGVANNITDVQVGQKITQLHARIHHLAQFRVPNTGSFGPLQCYQCGSSIPLYGRESLENRQGLFSKCVMCRDHAQIGTEIDSCARELKEELGSLSRNRSRDDRIHENDARPTGGGHTSHTTTKGLRLAPSTLDDTSELFTNTDNMQGDWLPSSNTHLTPRSVGRPHQRESSLSSLGSNRPASPHPSNTVNPFIAPTDSGVDSLHGMHNPDEYNNHFQLAKSYNPSGQPDMYFPLLVPADNGTMSSYPRSAAPPLVDTGDATLGQQDGAEAAETSFRGRESLRAPGGLGERRGAALVQLGAALDKLERVLEPFKLALSTKQRTLPHPNDLIIGHDTCAPFTDSGYASGPIEARAAIPQSRRPLQGPGDPDEKNTAAQSSIINEDAKTSYSAATSVDPICSRRYIQELSQDLYRNLQAQLDQPDWYSVTQVLPDLIKTFASKIGQEGDSQVHLDIMYFVHKRHRDIVRNLEDMFHDDRLDSTRKEDPESMSLLDKMDLWNRKGAEGGPEADPSDLFEGITDGKEEDEIDRSVDLSSYNKIVLGCSAYPWLISRLRKQCTLRFGESQTSTSSVIRACILDALPPTSVSKRRRPQIHMVAFRFSCESIFRRFQIENRKQDLSTGIASIMTTTLISHDEAQMATVGDYFRQTWPLGGEEILQVLERVLEALETMAEPEKHLEYGPVSFPSRTTIRVIVRGSYAVFSVTGLGDAIAEYGEQLAWLTSAVRPSRRGYSVSASPELRQWSQREQRANREPNLLTLAAGFDIEIWEQVTPLQSPKAPLGWCSRLLPDNLALVFAKGFPIARRPENGLGLELPVKILQEIRSDGMGLCGAANGSSRIWPHAGVKLSHRLGDVFYWRPNSAESSHEHGNRVDAEVSGWEAGRHILQECSPDDPEKTETPFESLQSSLLESPTIDMMSLSSDSEQVGRRDCNSPGFLFFKKLFGRILASYHAAAGESCGQGNGTTPGVVSGSNASSSGTTSNPSRKRNRRTLPGEEDDDQERPKAKKAKKEQPDCQRPRCFACPFWKRDSNKHWECILKKMTSISYVKQHLLRRHTPDFYCHRCYAIFLDARTYDEHVLRASCFRDESAKFEGITHDQSRQLSKKVIGTVETQWFAMWRVLFPHDPPPRSIYVDFDQAVDLGMVREFSHRHGVGILRDTLQSSGLLLRSGVSASELERVLGVGLDALFDHFRLSRQSALQPGTIPLPSASSGQREIAPTHGRSPQQRTAGDTSSDSAVAMGYHSPGSSFSSPVRHGNISLANFPAATRPIFEQQPSMPELAGFSLPRLPTNSLARLAVAHDSTMPAVFSSGPNFTGQRNECLERPIPSDPTGEDDGGPSDEVSGAEVFDLSESLGDGHSDWRGWEDLENPGPVDYNLDEILKGIVVEDSLLQPSLEWGE